MIQLIFTVKSALICSEWRQCTYLIELILIKNISSSTYKKKSVFLTFRHYENLRKTLPSTFIYEPISMNTNNIKTQFKKKLSMILKVIKGHKIILAPSFMDRVWWKYVWMLIWYHEDIFFSLDYIWTKMLCYGEVLWYFFFKTFWPKYNLDLRYHGQLLSLFYTTSLKYVSILHNSFIFLIPFFVYELVCRVYKNNIIFVWVLKLCL